MKKTEDAFAAIRRATQMFADCQRQAACMKGAIMAADGALRGQGLVPFVSAETMFFVKDRETDADGRNAAANRQCVSETGSKTTEQTESARFHWTSAQAEPDGAFGASALFAEKFAGDENGRSRRKSELTEREREIVDEVRQMFGGAAAAKNAASAVQAFTPAAEVTRGAAVFSPEKELIRQVVSNTVGQAGTAWQPIAKFAQVYRDEDRKFFAVTGLSSGTAADVGNLRAGDGGQGRSEGVLRRNVPYANVDVGGFRAGADTVFGVWRQADARVVRAAEILRGQTVGAATSPWLSDSVGSPKKGGFSENAAFGISSEKDGFAAGASPMQPFDRWVESAREKFVARTASETGAAEDLFFTELRQSQYPMYLVGGGGEGAAAASQSNQINIYSSVTVSDEIDMDRYLRELADEMQRALMAVPNRNY